MGILELFGKKDATGSEPAYDLSIQMHPIRLRANAADYADLTITVTSKFNKELLTSLVVVIPKELGLDQSALSHQREVRFGMLGAGEQKQLKLQIYATQRTPKGNYKIKIYAIAHYRDYSYVMNEVLKKADIRVE